MHHTSSRSLAAFPDRLSFSDQATDLLPKQFYARVIITSSKWTKVSCETRAVAAGKAFQSVYFGQEIGRGERYQLLTMEAPQIIFMCDLES